MNDPRDHAVAPDRPRQRHASARASRSRRSSWRRPTRMVNGGTLVQPHVVELGRRPGRDAGAQGPGRSTPSAPQTLVGPDEPRRDDVPFYRAGRSSRATTSAARPARPRSGTRRRTTGGLEGQHLQLLVRGLHRHDRARSWSSPSSPIRAARRSCAGPDRDAGHVVRALPAASRPTPSPRRDLPAGNATADRAPDVSPAVRHCGRRDRRPMRRPADRGTRAAARPDRRRDRPASPAGGCSCDSATARPRRRRRLAARRAGPLFVALPGERTRRPPVPRATPPRRARRPCWCAALPTEDPTPLAPRRRRDRRVADPLAALRRAGGRLAPPVRSARRRRHRLHRQDLDQGGRRGRAAHGSRDPDATRATRTTRSACRSPCCAWAPSTRRRSSRWACTSAARSPSWPPSPGPGSAS